MLYNAPFFTRCYILISVYFYVEQQCSPSPYIFIIKFKLQLCDPKHLHASYFLLQILIFTEKQKCSEIIQQPMSRGLS